MAVEIPTVSTEALAEAEDWEYLYILVEAYAQSVYPQEIQDSAASFSDTQIGLVIYTDLESQVNNGGFMQLIYNGYGPNVFQNGFLELLTGWGATELVELLKQAGSIYLENQEYLERERSIPEYSQLCGEFQHFEPLNDRFFDVIDAQSAIIRNYVKQHMTQFARLA